MNTSRSYGDKQLGQQLYRVIEFCNSGEALWHKIRSGQYDWLGVKETKGRETFVLGRPPRPKGVFASGFGTVVRPGADERYRVEVFVPTADEPSATHCTSEADARQEFDDKVAALARRDGSSGLFRVRLVLNGTVAKEEFVVRTEPNVI
ncbi:MAG TPA: hypothetical protein VJT49_23430 [Amycolatopsis sp.]|uniref:hypothetical protein n=1 Tax=Amycolatopsis sp. TaxID=37632 RepID=UPI002B475FAA|nr:hypothetical protein [Amycolatopsis sp.]HKS48008.1 hypothetical protein [Amycolatopsis sp.]